MKYAVTTKDWDKVKENMDGLQLNGFKPTVFMGKKGFVCEVDFFLKSVSGGQGVSYGSDQCCQPLLKRMANVLPKNCVEKA